MCGGFDRYYQIAHCWRDESQRADRALEFTQLDLEMSFVEQEDVLSLTEQLMAEVWRDAGHEVELPFPRMPYGEALAALRLRQARPALRARDRRRQRAGRGLRSSASSPARSAPGGVVRCLSVPGCRRGALAQGLRRAGGVREGVGRQGARVPDLRGRRQRALADREVPERGGGRRDPRGLGRRARLRRLHRRRRAGRRRARARRAAAAPRAPLRADPGGPLEVPLRRRLPALQADRGRQRLDGRAPSLHGAQARARGPARERSRRGRSRSPTTWC